MQISADCKMRTWFLKRFSMKTLHETWCFIATRAAQMQTCMCAVAKPPSLSETCLPAGDADVELLPHFFGVIKTSSKQLVHFFHTIL